MSESEVIQLNLKWDNFSSHLALSFDSCYESQQFVDVSLVCKDGEVIKGHKMILANTSKFFRRLLTENEHPHPMIVLHNIDADDLRSLMTFMYCGEVQVFQNDLKKLLEIADTLEITGLQQIQELDNPGIRFGVKNFATLNSDFDQTENLKNNDINKPASNLLKYVSSLGQKNLDNSVQSFESSSKKLQEMARKFEKCSNVGSWSFLQQTPTRNETKIREISGDCTLKTTQRIPDGEAAASLGPKSSSRKLQEMAKLLENLNQNPTLSEVAKGTSESHKRSLDSEETTESPIKKPHLAQSTPNTSEAEPDIETVRLGTAQDTNAGHLINEEEFIQNCSVYIKDELEVNTDCSTTPDVDLDNLQTDNLNITSNGENSGTSMLAAELLKAVANKRKVMAEDNEDVANYQVIEFIEEKDREKRSVDCVPSKWIKFDINVGRCVAKFMAPPFTKESKKLLDDLRKTNADAPDSWLWYPVVLVGKAKTYSEGLKKTTVLKSKSFAYSTENEKHCKKRSVATTKKHKSKEKLLKEKLLNKIMNAQDLTDSSNVESESSPPDSHDEDLSSSEDEMPVRKKNKNVRYLQMERYRKSDSATVKSTNSTSECNQAQLNIHRTTVTGSENHQTEQNDTVFQPVDSKNFLDMNKIFQNPQPQPVASTSKSEQIHDGRHRTVYSEDAKLLQRAITSMAADVKKNSQDIKALRKAIEGVLKKKVNEVTIESFAAKYEMCVPMRTVIELECFIQRLSDDDEMHAHFVAALEHLIEEDVNRTVTCIVKKLFHRDLAMVCTAVRKSKDKVLLRDTKLYATLFEFLCDHHVGKMGGPYTDREFKKTFGTVLYNSKDWDGHRSLRKT